MDALSDVLATLRIQSTLSSRCECRGSWAFRFAGHDSHIKFGTVLQGSLQLKLEGLRRPTVFQPGDFYLLTGNRPFMTSSVPPALIEQDIEAFRAGRCPDGVVRHGTQGPLVSIQSGRFTFEGEAGRLLLRHLPPLVQLRAEDPATGPLVHLLELLRAEDDPARPGTSVAQASVAALLLVQALRIHLAREPQPQGWLGAMADARVGAALSAMHGDLQRRWTVQSLAQQAGMSRTAFAQRFRDLTGTTPLDYLTDWRMTVARSLLKGGDEPVAHVGERVGYVSDTAFSAAFKRATGSSPARFRSAQAASA